MKLEAQKVSAGYGRNLVIRGVDLAIPARSVTTLLGPNGCGKSTVIKTMGRLLGPRAGTVRFDGRELGEYGANELARRMALLPQLLQNSGDWLVEELVSFGRFPHRSSGGGRARDRAAIDRAIGAMRLGELRRRPVGSLSGGERQRAWIAMTLAQEPEVLLLDEPTTFLDISCQFEIVELVRSLNRERGLAVVMVLHDLNLAARCSDRLVMMKDGRIRHIGTPEELMTPEILREIFSVEVGVTVASDGIPYCLVTGSARRDS